MGRRRQAAGHLRTARADDSRSDGRRDGSVQGGESMNSVPSCSDCSECSDLLSASTRVRARAPTGFVIHGSVYSLHGLGRNLMGIGNHCIHCIRCTGHEKRHCRACDRAFSRTDRLRRSTWRPSRLANLQRAVMSRPPPPSAHNRRCADIGLRPCSGCAMTSISAAIALCAPGVCAPRRPAGRPSSHRDT